MKPLPHLSGIVYVIAGAVLVVVAAIAGAVLARDRDQTQRIIAADSAAHEHQMRGVILNRDAKAERARADSATMAATREHAVADSLRKDLHVLEARAASTSAAVDRSTLRPDVLEALDAADRFRLAVTPTLAANSIDVATWKGSAERWQHAYELQSEAYAEQGAAYVALETENRALKRQHAPRCGWKCGAVIGASVAVAALGGITYLVVAAAAP